MEIEVNATLDEKNRKRQTSIKKGTYDAVFGEDFFFQVKFSDCHA